MRRCEAVDSPLVAVYSSPRNQASGAATTTLTQYTNQASIAEAGFDFALNWIGNFSDLGVPVPGAITFSTQDTLLGYYRTKPSPASFDVSTNWKGSLGPNLAGTNAGAYSFRLFSSIGYVLPSVAVNLRWRFLPSVNSANHASQQAIIENDERVAAGAKGTLLSYIPNTDLAAPAWSAFDLSGNWTVTKVARALMGSCSSPNCAGGWSNWGGAEVTGAGMVAVT